MAGRIDIVCSFQEYHAGHFHTRGITLATFQS